MKLIRWVEVHIGRSRRKSKKEKDGLTINCGADIPRRRDESTPSTPLHKIEPIGKDLPRSAGSTPQRLKHPPSPHPLLRAPETPSIDGRLHIRTSFLDPGLNPLSAGPQPLGFGSSTALDTGSPRVRCRIRTNPWLPSPKSNAGDGDCRWNGGSGGIRSSSIGSESSESIAGSGFGSQSSGSLWEGYSGEPWSGIRLNGRSPSSTRLPRVTLERSAIRQRTVIESDRLSFGDDEDKPYCPATYCRPIPRSAWMDFRELTTDILENTRDDDESSDEAYSEDYVHSEEQDELPLDVMRPSKGGPPDTGSPQADSACGSDRDNSSCSTTPLSETPSSSSTKKSLVESKELLQDKVQRLRIERHLVDQRIKEARAEEIIRREEQLILQRELVQFRRLLLLQTLSELRSQLERQGKRLHRNYGEGKEDKNAPHINPEEDDGHWLHDRAELVG